MPVLIHLQMLFFCCSIISLEPYIYFLLEHYHSKKLYLKNPRGKKQKEARIIHNLNI